MVNMRIETDIVNTCIPYISVETRYNMISNIYIIICNFVMQQSESPFGQKEELIPNLKAGPSQASTKLTKKRKSNMLGHLSWLHYD